MTVTLGTDPEFFLQTNDGTPVSVCGKIGGTKGDALDIGGGYAIQEDNVMVEWNIEPQDNPYDFARVTYEGTQRVMDFVRTKTGKDIHPLLSAWVRMPANQLVTMQAREFGCSVDYGAYLKGDTLPVMDPEEFDLPEGDAYRFAGGHVHIGYDNPNEVPEFVVAALADVYLGLYAVGKGENQGRRRRQYGTAGRYRPTTYGIEYRTLSNWWLSELDYCEAIGNAAFDLGVLIESAPVEQIQKAYATIPWNDVKNAIANEDRDAANRLRLYCVNVALGHERGGRV